MFWIIGITRHGARVATRVPGHVAKYGQHCCTHWTPATGGVTTPPHHDLVTLTVILLALLMPAVFFFFVLGMVFYRKPRPARDLEESSLVTGWAAYPSLEPELPPAASGNGNGSPVTRKMRIAVTLFASPCDDCGAVRSQPCKPVPGPKIAVVDPDRNWFCHVSRIVKGTKENKKLYLELIRNWDGEVPGELKGLH